MVVAGFMTSKGELVRSIMFPKPADFRFSQDAFKFIGALALVATCGMIYTLVLMVSSRVFNNVDFRHASILRINRATFA